MWVGGRDGGACPHACLPACLHSFQPAFCNFTRLCSAAVADYLHCKVFGLPASLAPDGRKTAVVPPSFSSPEGQLVTVWRDNVSFPGWPELRCILWQQQVALQAACSLVGRAPADLAKPARLAACRAPPLPRRDSPPLHPPPNCLPCPGLPWLQDFPYHLSPGISHFNLWANRRLSDAQVEAHIKQQVRGGARAGWGLAAEQVGAGRWGRGGVGSERACWKRVICRSACPQFLWLRIACLRIASQKLRN